MRNPHSITADFEEALASYTGAKYAVAVDNCSNALFLALSYDNVKGKEITIPCRTYPSVPCEIIRAGGIVKFRPVIGNSIKGHYWLTGSNVIDSALSFTADMYVPGSYMCLSFTGPYKHLKLGKGGAILTDNYSAYLWFKRSRFSGRRECSYHDDNFDMLGINAYMMPEIAARGILLMGQFYNLDGTARTNEDISMSYPDLSQFKVYRGVA